MPELHPTYALIADVRRQLLDAAAFDKHLTPDHLEHLAGTLAGVLRACVAAPPVGPACFDYRGRLRPRR